MATSKKSTKTTTAKRKKVTAPTPPPEVVEAPVSEDAEQGTNLEYRINPERMVRRIAARLAESEQRRQEAEMEADRMTALAEQLVEENAQLNQSIRELESQIAESSGD